MTYHLSLQPWLRWYQDARERGVVDPDPVAPPGLMHRDPEDEHEWGPPAVFVEERKAA